MYKLFNGGEYNYSIGVVILLNFIGNIIDEFVLRHIKK